MTTQRGFTLIELMITVAIVAILTTIALPSFTQMTKNNRLTTQANNFIQALNLSRSEAVKRGANVTITRTTGDWTNGWTVTDVAGNALRIGDPLPNTVTLTNATNAVTYTASGAPVVAPGNFDLCDNRSGETGRRISISVTGRVDINNLACS